MIMMKQILILTQLWVAVSVLSSIRSFVEAHDDEKCPCQLLERPDLLLKEKRQAVIESAVELGAQTGNELLEGLRNKYGDDLTAEFLVNEDLIGGMRVKVGSDVWDGSVRARLTNLKDSL